MVTTSVKGVIYDPRHKTKPYFFVTKVNGVQKYWWFPTLEAAAKAKRDFTKTTWKESIILYGCPVAKQPNPNAKNKADTWTSAFYTGKLEHA